jgi:hypothetical protein
LELLGVPFDKIAEHGVTTILSVVILYLVYALTIALRNRGKSKMEINADTTQSFLAVLTLMAQGLDANRQQNQATERRQQERFEQTIKVLEARMGDIQKEDKAVLDPLLTAIPAKTEEKLLPHFDAISGKVSTVVQSQLDLQAINLAALRTDLTDKLQEAMAILKQIEGGFEAALQRELAEINQKLDDLATTIRVNGFGNDLLPPPPLIALKTLPDAAVPQTPETPSDASAQAETMTEEKR